MRSEQDQVESNAQKRIASLLVHGDAAFAGLGIVAECLQMSNVTGNSNLSWLHILCAMALYICNTLTVLQFFVKRSQYLELFNTALFQNFQGVRHIGERGSSFSELACRCIAIG